MVQPSDDTFRCSPVFDVPYIDHNNRVDVPYVGIAAAERALDERAYSSVSQCCSLPRRERATDVYVDIHTCFVICCCEHTEDIPAFSRAMVMLMTMAVVMAVGDEGNDDGDGDGMAIVIIMGMMMVMVVGTMLPMAMATRLAIVSVMVLVMVIMMVMVMLLVVVVMVMVWG